MWSWVLVYFVPCENTIDISARKMKDFVLFIEIFMESDQRVVIELLTIKGSGTEGMNNLLLWIEYFHWILELGKK